MIRLADITRRPEVGCGATEGSAIGGHNALEVTTALKESSDWGNPPL